MQKGMFKQEKYRHTMSAQKDEKKIQLPLDLIFGGINSPKFLKIRRIKSTEN